VIGRTLEIIIDGLDAAPRGSRGRIIGTIPAAYGTAWLVDFDGRERAVGNIPAPGSEIQTFRILAPLEELALAGPD
jgi:hypothetical protein